MKEIVLSSLFVLLLAPLATADVYITEIMHSPTQISDNDGEWVELYNSGNEAVDLASWTLDGEDFDDVVIQPGQYIVVARELIDGDDADTESFESYWGNNNAIWDEDFTAVDGKLNLKADDILVLTDGMYRDEVVYDASFGGEEGTSIERVGDGWQEGPLAGSPGRGTDSQTETPSNSIDLYLTIAKNELNVTGFNITVDDSSAPGTQIMPNVLLPKNVSVVVTVSYTQNVPATSLWVNGQSWDLRLVSNTSTDALYQGSFSMDYFDQAGMYNGTISAIDGNASATTQFSFEYLGMLVTELNTTSIQFSSESGLTAEREITVRNTGNVPVVVEVSAHDFVSPVASIDKRAIEIFSGTWIPLNTTLVVADSLDPNLAVQVPVRVNVPHDAHAGSYRGSIIINSRERRENA